MYTLEEATYQFEKEVPGYLCDIRNKMKLSCVLKYIQEAGTTQFDLLGFTYELLCSENIVSLLSKLSIKIHRMPEGGEQLRIVTNPQRTKGASFLRRVEFFSEAGDLLVEAQSAWLMVSTETRKILRPSQFPHEIPAYVENYNAELAETKIKASGIVIKNDTRKVRFTDLDCNIHMNNTVYADVVMDLLPFEVASTQDIDLFIISYKSEALYEEDIALSLETLDDGYYIGGNKENGACFEAMITFKK